MTTLRSIRDLLAEAAHEAFLLADRALQWAENRWLWVHEHRWIDESTLADRDVHEVCADCGQTRTVTR